MMQLAFCVEQLADKKTQLLLSSTVIRIARHATPIVHIARQ